MEEKVKKRLSKPRIVIIVICSVILAAAIAFAILYLVQANKAADLAEETITQYLIPVEDEEEGSDNKFKVDWEGLWAINPDVVAWIQVPAIPTINYPVVHYTDNDYYLRRSWTGEPLEAGCIMEDYHCSPDFYDFHTIVYGHNMTFGPMAGTMFGQLKKFQDQSFYDENDDTVIIYTPEMDMYYEIFSVHVVAPNDYSVYLVGDFTRDQAFDFVDGLRESSEIDTGVWADGDDRILTLSTCSGTGSTRRLVVHAKLIDERIPVDGLDLSGTTWTSEVSEDGSYSEAVIDDDTLTIYKIGEDGTQETYWVGSSNVLRAFQWASMRKGYTEMTCADSTLSLRYERGTLYYKTRSEGGSYVEVPMEKND